MLRLALVQRLFQRVQNEIGVHEATHPPADDASGANINDKSHEQQALPGLDIVEVRHPCRSPAV